MATIEYKNNEPVQGNNSENKMMVNRHKAMITKRASIFLIALLSAAIPSVPVQAQDLPGASPTSYQVSPTGAFQFQLPIVAPAGTAGHQPSVSLAFSSDSDNGPLGVGWNLSGLGVISRCPQTIVRDGLSRGVNFDGGDRYCLNGSPLVLVSDGVYGGNNTEYRTEVDQFIRIRANGSSTNINGGFSPQWWEVWRRDGSREEYGRNLNSRFIINNNADDNPSSILRWNLYRVFDQNDNYYTVSYEASEGLPSEINYTINALGIAADKKISFNYEDRPDTTFAYRAGVKIDRAKRLESIEVSKSNQVVRSYDVDYELAPVSERSRIQTITECGLNNECMPPIELEWEQGQAGLVETNEEGEIAPSPLITTNPIIESSGIAEHDFNIGEWVDINGDGLLDQVVAMQLPETPPAVNEFDSYVILKKQDGSWEDDRETSQPSNWRLPRALRSFAIAVSNFSVNSRFRANVINYGVLKDVNGDGLVDVVYSFDLLTDPNQSDLTQRLTVNETYLNTGDGWEKSEEYAPKDIMFDYVSNTSGSGTELSRVVTVRSTLIDVNGDGLDDWVSAYQVYGANNTTTNHQSTWLNNGNGWNAQPTSSYALPDVFVEYDNGFTIEHGRFIDLNGDGLVDWLQAFARHQQPLNANAWINTGNGWVQDNTYALPIPVYTNLLPITTSAATVTGSFVDVNGDGLTDFMLSFAVASGNEEPIQRVGAYINTGNGWISDQGYQPQFIQIDNGRSFVFRTPVAILGNYIDLNRDGLVDYVSSFRNDIGEEFRDTWMNTGSGWNREGQNSPYIIDEDIYDFSNFSVYIDFADEEFDSDDIFEQIFQQPTVNFFNNSRGANSITGHFIDINNDGLLDWVKNHDPYDSIDNLFNSRNSIPEFGTKISPRNGIERLSSIKTTSGVLIKPTFMPLTSSEVYTKGQDEPEEGAANAISATYVVSQIETSRPDGVGFNTVTYQYAGAQINREGRGLLGFKSITSVNTNRDSTTFTEYRQDFPYIGLVDRNAVMVGNRTISASENEYNFREILHSDSGQSTFFPYLERTVAIADELDSELNVPFSQEITEYTYDQYGNIETSSKIVRDASGDVLRKVSTVSNYFLPIITTTDWFLNLVRNTSITQSKPDQQESTNVHEGITNVLAYEYDLNGQVEKITREPNTDLELDTLFDYDNFGNVIQETLSSVADGIRTVQSTYDDQHRLVETATNAINQSASTEYHPLCDTPSEITDLNGLIVTIDYDNFCREIRRTGPDGVETSTDYIVINSPNQCFDCQVEPVFKTIETISGEPPIETFYNSFNQPLLATTSGMLGETINQRFEYDDLGRLVVETQPYFLNETQYNTLYEYDVLDRLRKTTFPFLIENNVNATQTSDFTIDASGRAEQISTDTKGRSTRAFSNALNQTIQVQYVNGSSLQYRYDVQLNLAQTIDAAGNVINVGFDKLSRRTSLDDPDLGLTTYEYNVFGELISQTDAKQQTITYEYDALGRITQQTVPVIEGSGGVSTWTYDQGDNAIGQISSVTGPNGFSQSFEYDEFGRLEVDSRMIRGEFYQQRYGYDEFGRISFKRYPDSGSGNEFSVHYNYVNGYLSSITDRNDGIAGCIEHWRADQYDALGRLTDSTLGKIIGTRRDYDGAQGVLDRIESNLLVGNTDLIQDLNYTYDATNNVLSRNDVVLSTNETFEYDSQDRLRFHRTAGGESVEAQYNEIGNITYKSNVGTYSYNGDGGPHALSRVELPLNAQDSFDRFRVNFDNGSQQFVRELPTIHGQNFVYDDNGNTEQSGNRSLFWTAFDKPYLMMVQQANGSQLGSYIEYGADQQRVYKEERTFNSVGNVTGVTERTVYVGSGYQRISNSSDGIVHRYTISVDGSSIQIDRNNGSSRDKAKYLLTDNLGSTNVIVNALGEVEQRLAFDPWGMRTNIGDTNSVNDISNRGFTGHEMDDETGLVNMNARVYDPYLGRFLSADPVLQAPLDMQSYNRYTYVFNNPLKYVDPSGNITTIAGSFTNTTTSVVGSPSSNAIPTISVSVNAETSTRFGGGGITGITRTDTVNDGFVTDSSFGIERSPLTTTSITIININIVIDFMNSTGGGGPRDSVCIAGSSCNSVSTTFGGNGAANNEDFFVLHFGDFDGSLGREAQARSEREFGSVAARNRAQRNRERAGRNGEGRSLSRQLDDLQIALEVGGLFPVFGAVPDVINTAIFVFRGDFTGAAISAVAIVPILGQAATGAKIADRAVDAARQCFVKGTLIHTKEGVKPIEEIQVGDMVASKSDKSGEVDWKPVVQLFTNHDKTILNISFESVTGKSETLGTTDEHPFWVKGKGWVVAEQLEIGDKITTLEDGLMTVSAMATSSEKQTTYNFEVEEFHTYFVGESAVWVHNMCVVPELINGANPRTISPENARRIQRAADSSGQEITVIGSRARGDADPLSDFDFIVPGNSNARQKARRFLPRGGGGGAQTASGGDSGIDVFTPDEVLRDALDAGVDFSQEAQIIFRPRR